MLFKKIHKSISFRQLLWFLIGFALIIQLSVITYNHFSGFYILRDFQHFLLRLLRGTLMSLFAGFLVVYPDLIVIQSLNSTYSWGQKTLNRLALQFPATLVIALLVSVGVTLFANWLKPYTEDFRVVLWSNALIYAVVNIILMAILEGWLFSVESNRAKKLADELNRELSQIRFEVLKSQINPHFMFNSLNVLSGLISKDSSKAQQFIDRFSQVYRYVLETIEHTVTTLEKELEFMRSYLFLQQIRYSECLSYSVSIPSSMLKLYLPPLSLQVVLENAIKHNVVNESNPLHIEITGDALYLKVKNNVQPKISFGTSTGVGLKNLVKRYALISKEQPQFYLENDYYIAKLPLIKSDDDESTDY